jgi:hypothetical protein
MVANTEISDVKPWASCATLLPDPPPSMGEPARPAPIYWTPALLLTFLQHLLGLRSDEKRPLGSISMAFSGPKPDPFIALHPPRPLVPHTSRSSEGLEKTGMAMRPVRPEMGDHLRIYVDADRALALRMWLNGVERGFQEGKDGKETDGKGYTGLLFYRVRLALVGERGEVLTVA